jgi:hypothetical protein
LHHRNVQPEGSLSQLIDRWRSAGSLRDIRIRSRILAALVYGSVDDEIENRNREVA